MKRIAFAFAIAAIAATSPSAGAVPTAPAKSGAGAPALRPVVPTAFKARMGQRITTKTGKSMTAQEVVDAFDPTSKVTLPNGKTVTVQDLVDRLGRSEIAIQAQKSSLTAAPKKAWAKPSTSTKISAQRASLAGEVATMKSKAGAPNLQRANPIQTPASCTASTCSPTEKSNALAWDKQKGDEDTVAAYSNLSLKSETPDSFTTICQASWDNGLYLLGKQASVLKFTADVKSTRTSPAGFAASAALYIAGQSTPVWKKEGKVSAESLDRTFAPPKVSLKQPIVPGISLEGEVKASATLSFKPTIDGTLPSNGSQCTLGLTPRLVGNVDGKASVVIGIPDLLELAEGGVGGTVSVVDAQIPTNLSLSLTQQPLALDLRFKSDLQVRFMKGRIYGFYKIGDICILGACLVEDGLGIPTYGEIDLWEEASGFGFDVPLVDKNTQIPFAKGT